jgi:hypothetical protein
VFVKRSESRAALARLAAEKLFSAGEEVVYFALFSATMDGGASQKRRMDASFCENKAKKRLSSARH